MTGRGKGGKGLGKGGAKRHRKVLRDNIQGKHIRHSLNFRDNVHGKHFRHFLVLFEVISRSLTCFKNQLCKY